MANNSISLVNLDFDTLKTQLKTYLKGQSQFSDYDFDGSNMSVLLDILSYNSNMNAFYLNMVASEMFLDSAQLRNSVVSIAKALNYTPRSAKSARAKLNLRFAQSGLQSFTIPANTRFTGKNSRGSYQFLTDETIVLYPSGGYFTANGVFVYEGSLVTDAFVVDYSVEGQRFILSDAGIDTDSLRVTVIEDVGATTTTFSKVSSLYGVTATSDSFFLQAAEESRYEVVFGDGVFGRRPKDGAVITCTYRTTSAAAGNEATNFILNDNLGAYNGYGSAIAPTITVVSAAFGGGSAETIEEIRYRAPRYYQTQERAVTTGDFSSLILREFADIKNVYVYGGEQSSGVPQFGKVFVSPITYTGELLSYTEKDQIQTYLRDKTTIGIAPVVIDPDYLYVEPSVVVYYDQAATALTAVDVRSKVQDAIAAYNQAELLDFNTEFKTSRFSAAVDSADSSISSSETTILLRKRFAAELLAKTFPKVAYRNQIVPGTVTSSTFISGNRRYQYTDFNPNNNTFSVKQVDNQAVVTNSSRTVYLKDITTPGAVTYSPAGTVDYDAGTVTLNSITISSFDASDGLDFYARPTQENVASQDNDVISIDTSSASVLVKQA